MHTLLKHKMLQFLFYTDPTCFGPHGPSSGSTYQNLTKITLSFNICILCFNKVCICWKGKNLYLSKCTEKQQLRLISRVDWRCLPSLSFTRQLLLWPTYREWVTEDVEFVVSGCVLHQMANGSALQTSEVCRPIYTWQLKYRVIQNNCQGFNNLPYTTHMR
jgi:hypothetical protein